MGATARGEGERCASVFGVSQNAEAGVNTCCDDVLTLRSLLASQAECDCPKLLKFRGRPRDYSPKARFLNFLGFKLPFDRHDWVVDRCGTDVRYVIDFYNGAFSFLA